MKWMIVVIMEFIPGEDSTDFYIFTDPYFKNQQECRMFVNDPRQTPALAGKLVEVFGIRMINDVFCAPETKINRYILEQEAV